MSNPRVTLNAGNLGTASSPLPAPPTETSGIASFNSLESVVCEVRNDEFTYDHLINSNGGNSMFFHALTIVPLSNLLAGNVVPVLVGQDWSHITVKVFLQVVNVQPLTLQCLTYSTDYPAWSTVVFPIQKILILSNTGLTRIKRLDITTTNPIVQLDFIPPYCASSSSSFVSFPSLGTVQSNINTMGALAAMPGLSVASSSSAQQEKMTAVLRIVGENHMKVCELFGSQKYIDTYHAKNVAVSRLPEDWRSFPAFQHENIMNIILFNCSYFQATSCPKAEGFHISQLVALNSESKPVTWKEINNSKYAFSLFEIVIDTWSAIYKEKDFFRNAFKNVFNAFTGIERLLFKIKASKVVNILSAKLSSFCAILRSIDTIGMSKDDIVSYCLKNIEIDTTSVILNALTDKNNEKDKRSYEEDYDKRKKFKSSNSIKDSNRIGTGLITRNPVVQGAIKYNELCLSDMK